MSHANSYDDGATSISSSSSSKMPFVKFVCTVEYDGSCFSGWTGGFENCIDKVLQSVMHVPSKNEKDINHNIVVKGSGRTDKGVHALGQVFHVDISTTSIMSKFTSHRFLKYTNDRLQQSKFKDKIKLLNVSIVPDGISFHARHSTIRRSYLYRVCISKSVSLHEKNKCWHVPIDETNLNLDLIQESLDLIKEKEHDFSCFQSPGCVSKTTKRFIEVASMVKCDDTWSGSSFLQFEFSSKAFMYHQIRNMMGALISIGKRKITLNQLQECLSGSHNQTLKKFILANAAPPDGLFLKRMEYTPNDWLNVC